MTFALALSDADELQEPLLSCARCESHCASHTLWREMLLSLSFLAFSVLIVLGGYDSTRLQC